MSLEHAPQRQKKKGGGSRRTDYVPPAAYTIEEFCAAHRISLALYYKLRTVGRGPREAHVLTKPIITMESAADWRRAREADAIANESANADDAVEKVK